jgi:hypothetical protein
MLKIHFTSFVSISTTQVTERTRHQIPHRAFDQMQEITHLIDQRGVHGNRGDMRQVKEWMGRYGLEDEFGFVMGM